jgi:transcriptional regulator with XRE-family HTH domain
MAAKFNRPSEARTLGALLKESRLSAKLTTIDLSLRTQIHQSQISRIENGHFASAANNVQKLCNYLQIDLHKSISSRSPKALIDRLESLTAAEPRWRQAFESFLDAAEESQKLKTISSHSTDRSSSKLVPTN